MDSKSATEQKKDAILCHAIHTFAQQGFRNTDVQVIADAAGVGKGTVYRHFGNKEDLFLAAADAGMQRLQKQIFAAIEQDPQPLRALRSVALTCAEFFQKHPELIEILIQERAEFRGSIPETHLVYRQKNRGILEDLFRKGIAEGVVRELDVREATNAFANLIYGTVVCGTARVSASIHRLVPMMETAVDIFLRGVSVEEKAVG